MVGLAVVGVTAPTASIAELVAECGDGLLLAARLWEAYDRAARLTPGVSAIELYDQMVRRPLAAAVRGAADA